MSWSDVLFPGNPSRRNKVLQLYTKAMTLLEVSFKATNDLIDIVHEHVPGQTFLKIAVDLDKTIKENCSVFINTVTAIEKYLKEKNKALEKELDPEMYRTIMDTKVKFGKKIEYGRKLGTAALAITGTVTGLAVVAFIYKGTIMVSAVETFGILRVCLAANIMVASIVMGTDMIISAIIGSIERNKLEESIVALEKAMDGFEKASYEYARNIRKLDILIELSLQSPM